MAPWTSAWSVTPPVVADQASLRASGLRPLLLRQGTLSEDLPQVGVQTQPHAGPAGITSGALIGRGRPCPGNRHLEGEDGVVIEARYINHDHAGLCHVYLLDRFHVCQYAFVHAAASQRGWDSPGRRNCQCRRLPSAA